MTTQYGDLSMEFSLYHINHTVRSVGAISTRGLCSSRSAVQPIRLHSHLRSESECDCEREREIILSSFPLLNMESALHFIRSNLGATSLSHSLSSDVNVPLNRIACGVFSSQPSLSLSFRDERSSTI